MSFFKKKEEKKNSSKSLEQKINESESEEKYPRIYVITSAQSISKNKEGVILKNLDNSLRGGPNKEFLEGLEYYCESRGGELYILPMAGQNAKERDIHPDLMEYNNKKYKIFKGVKRLNDNVEIAADMTVPPQNVDPATGRDRFVQREQSKIYAHTKQRFKPVNASNSKLPKLIITPGAVTYPNYNINNHRGDAAYRDHTFGAVIVEVINNRLYNLRQIRAQKDGKFVDMGIKYDKKRKPEKAKAEALVLGDIHVGDTDPIVRKANYEMIEYFKPERLFIHDLFNGQSVNYHEMKDSVTRAKTFLEGKADLEKELKMCYDEVCEFAKAMKKKEVNIVFSNHHKFLNKYLEDKIFMEEPWNIRIGLKLCDKLVSGEDPVEAGIKMMGPIPKNVRFLKLGENYKVWGYQLADHGDKGLSGGRGSIRARELGHGKSITGHTHAPEILRNTYVVGTSTYLDLKYTTGQASSWMSANAVLYEGGLVQILPIIEGKWKMN